VLIRAITYVALCAAVSYALIKVELQAHQSFILLAAKSNAIFPENCF